MYLSPYPENTKQTRCNNNINQQNQQNHDSFLRPILTNQQIPISFNHDHYTNEKYIQRSNNINNRNNINNMNNMNNINNINHFDIERNSISTRNNYINSNKPVQHTFQNDYYMTNFDTLNNNIDSNQEVNNFLTRNPVNTRRDHLEKSRNQEKQEFLKTQGGALNNFVDFKLENTRTNKGELNSSSYIPMPRTMAIPKEIL
jgi:hypothetical protein